MTDKIYNTIRLILLSLTAFSLSMPTFFFNLFFLITVIVSLPFIFKKTSIILFKDKYFQVLFAFFILLIIGLINTSEHNLGAGLKLIERRLPIILLPIIFFGVQSRYRKIILSSFALGVLVAIFVCLTNVVLTPGVYGEIKQIYISNWYWNDRLLEPIDKHPSYFAFYNIFSFFILLNLVIDKRKNLNYLFLLPLAFLNLIVLLTLEARLAIFSFPIALLIFVYYKFRNVKLSLITVLLFLSVGTTYFMLHPAKFHNIRILRLDKDTSVRFQVYNSSSNVIKKNLGFGVGTGDYQEELLKEYKRANFEFGINKKLNSHNQFIEETLRGGMVGLILFMLVLFVPAYLSIKSKSVLFIIFSFISIMSMVSESTLNRQQGISFVFFFICLFVFLKNDKN